MLNLLPSSDMAASPAFAQIRRYLMSARHLRNSRSRRKDVGRAGRGAAYLAQISRSAFCKCAFENGRKHRLADKVDRLLPVEMPMAPLPNGIVTLKNRALGPVVQLFIDSARDVAKRLAKR